jgi:hypothetical protein
MCQTFYLREGVHVAAVGGDLVTLDTAAGAYGCFPGLGSAVERRGPGGCVEVANAGAAAQLVEAGLLGAGPQAEALPLPPPMPIRSVWRTGRVAVAPTDFHRLAAAYLRAAPGLWRLSFGKLLAHAIRERPRDADPSPDALRHDAQAFDQLMPFVPFQGQCLFRSRLLLAFLRSGGRDAQWVFGVRTYPFGAHCWLQSDDTVLDDAAEAICAYVPILAV